MTKIIYKPYLFVFLIWSVVSLTIIQKFTGNTEDHSLRSGVLFLSLALLNLFFLVKMIEITIKLMSDQGTENRNKERLSLLLFGGLKLSSLGGFFYLIYQFNEKSILSCVLCGIGTLFVVPLFGGVCWNFFWNNDSEKKNLRNSSR